ncbi:MAG: hypothetical protein QXU71_03700, partial [Candidatus Aenigmatarchaeota archaeon]
MRVISDVAIRFALGVVITVIIAFCFWYFFIRTTPEDIAERSADRFVKAIDELCIEYLSNSDATKTVDIELPQVKYSSLMDELNSALNNFLSFLNKEAPKPPLQMFNDPYFYLYWETFPPENTLQASKEAGVGQIFLMHTTPEDIIEDDEEENNQSNCFVCALIETTKEICKLMPPPFNIFLPCSSVKAYEGVTWISENRDKILKFLRDMIMPWSEDLPWSSNFVTTALFYSAFVGIDVLGLRFFKDESKSVLAGSYRGLKEEIVQNFKSIINRFGGDNLEKLEKFKKFGDIIDAIRNLEKKFSEKIEIAARKLEVIITETEEIVVKFWDEAKGVWREVKFVGKTTAVGTIACWIFTENTLGDCIAYGLLFGLTMDGIKTAAPRAAKYIKDEFSRIYSDSKLLKRITTTFDEIFGSSNVDEIKGFNKEKIGMFGIAISRAVGDKMDKIIEKVFSQASEKGMIKKIIEGGKEYFYSKKRIVLRGDDLLEREGNDVVDFIDTYRGIEGIDFTSWKYSTESKIEGGALYEIRVAESEISGSEFGKLYENGYNINHKRTIKDYYRIVCDDEGRCYRIYEKTEIIDEIKIDKDSLAKKLKEEMHLSIVYPIRKMLARLEEKAFYNKIITTEGVSQIINSFKEYVEKTMDEDTARKFIKTVDEKLYKKCEKSETGCKEFLKNVIENSERKISKMKEKNDELILLIRKDSKIAEIIENIPEESTENFFITAGHIEEMVKGTDIMDKKLLYDVIRLRTNRLSEDMNQFLQGSLGHALFRMIDLYTPLGFSYWDKFFSFYGFSGPTAATEKMCQTECTEGHICINSGPCVIRFKLPESCEMAGITSIRLERNSIIDPNPRFYLVSPCYAKLQMYIKNYTNEIGENETTIFIKPYLKRVEDKANYCYATEGLVNFWVGSYAAEFAVGCTIGILCTAGTGGIGFDGIARCLGFKVPGVCSLASSL